MRTHLLYRCCLDEGEDIFHDRYTACGLDAGCLSRKQHPQIRFQEERTESSRYREQSDLQAVRQDEGSEGKNRRDEYWYLTGFATGVATCGSIGEPGDGLQADSSTKDSS